MIDLPRWRVIKVDEHLIATEDEGLKYNPLERIQALEERVKRAEGFLRRARYLISLRTAPVASEIDAYFAERKEKSNA
jgi:hypothetical protein